MQIKLNPAELKTKLNIVNNCLDSGIPHQILTGVLIKTCKNSIHLTTTNLEVVIKTKLMGNFEEDGEILVPCATLNSIISKLDSKECILETKDNKLIVRQGKLKFNIGLLDKEEFPKIKKINWIDIGKGKIKIIRNSLFASQEAISSGNQILYSLFFDKDKIIATDSTRLIISKINPLKESFLLPFPTALLLSNIFDEYKVFLSEEKDKVLFSNGETLLQSSLIDGEYVNYKNVIPKNKFKFSIKKTNLILLLERAMIIDIDLTEFIITKDKIIVKSNSKVSSYEEEIKSNFTGKELKIKFNPKYLLDFLNIYNDEIITLEVDGSEKPILIKGKEIIYLFLPMRV